MAETKYVCRAAKQVLQNLTQYVNRQSPTAREVGLYCSIEATSCFAPYCIKVTFEGCNAQNAYLSLLGYTTPVRWSMWCFKMSRFSKAANIELVYLLPKLYPGSNKVLTRPFLYAVGGLRT
jgi:hypothetical protein